MTTIAQNLNRVTAAISKAEQTYQRQPGSVQLLAASKTRTPAEIRQAYAAGQHAFGENYLQEALFKVDALADIDIEWHFIGPLQSNKTPPIATYFSWVHSVDRYKIAERLNYHRPSHLPPLKLCIQININAEPNKSGILLTELLPLATQIAALPRIQLCGLMAIPKQTDNITEQRKHFKALHTAQQQLNRQGFKLTTLSVGMSNDFAAAIAEGSTIIRIGTAIFGPRDYVK